MSTDLIVRHEHGYRLTKLREDRFQLSPLLEQAALPEGAHPLHVKLSTGGLEQLARDILNLGDTPTPEEMGTALTEMGEDRDRLYNAAEAARAQAAEFEEDLRETRQELEEQKQAARELFEEAKAARKEAAEAREELRAAGVERRKLKEETEVLGKELAHAREAREKVERDLSRALGYIDRVVEDEPPVKDPVTVINRHCGDIGESFTTGTPRRGPVLSGSDPWR